MKEDHHYTYRAHIFDTEDIKMEEATAQGAPVGKLILDQLMRERPTYKETGKEASYGQEDLACDKVKEVEEGHAEYLKTLIATKRERAEDAHDETQDGDRG